MRGYMISASIYKIHGPFAIPALQSPRCHAREDVSLSARLTALRNACGLTLIQPTVATKTTLRSISYYENDGCPWKQFQLVTLISEKDRRAVIGLIHSLAVAGSLPKTSASQEGERHGR